MKTFAACLTVALIGCTTLAYGQNGFADSMLNPKNRTGYGVPGHHYGFGAPVAGFVHHSSTYEEGCMRGWAAMTQAQGQYNLLTSLAAMNMMEVQRMQREMERQRAAEMAAMRAEYDQRKAERVAATRERNLARNQELAAADRLAVAIAWPSLLQQPSLDGYRRLVERLAGQQASGKRLSASDDVRLQTGTKTLLGVLQRDGSPEAHAAARFVLNGFSDVPANAVRLASN